MDVALAGEGAALAIAGSQTGEAGDGAATSSAQFGKQGQEGGGADGANAWGFLETASFGTQNRLGGEVGGDELIELGTAFVELGEALCEIAAQELVGGGFQVLGFQGDERDDLRTALDQCGEMFLARARSRCGSRLEEGT